MDYVIIVAGGKGTRMGTELPKQFLPIHGLPVLMHTMLRFHSFSSELQLIVVLPREQHDFWRSLCRQHRFQLPHLVAEGGQTRFESSRNGLALIPDDAEGVCAIHDGVRPFVSPDVIARCMETARSEGAAIPVMPVTDTLRQIVPSQEAHNVDRSRFRVVQTPQCFQISLLKKAYRQPYDDRFTDDASVVESIGEKVAMVDGNRENIKLTTPFDLRLAEFLCAGGTASGRR